MCSLHPASCATILAVQKRGLWALAFATLGLSYALASITPLGISSQIGGQLLLLEASFIGTLIGCSAGLMSIGHARTPLARAHPGRQLLFESSAILGPAVLLLLAAIAPQMLSTGQAPPLIPTLLILAHLSALALVLTRLRLKPATTAALLPLLAWILPAFLAPTDSRMFVRLMRAAIDPTCAYAFVGQTESLLPLLWACLAPILGLLGLRAALTSMSRLAPQS